MNLILVAGLTISVISHAAKKELPVQATSISQVQQNIKDTQQQLENITGKICGVRIETISDPLMRKIRCLDKLVDELAAGRPVAKILNRS